MHVFVCAVSLCRLVLPAREKSCPVLINLETYKGFEVGGHYVFVPMPPAVMVF